MFKQKQLGWINTILRDGMRLGKNVNKERKRIPVMIYDSISDQLDWPRIPAMISQADTKGLELHVLACIHSPA